jgi:hypothetical protein
MPDYLVGTWISGGALAVSSADALLTRSQQVPQVPDLPEVPIPVAAKIHSRNAYTKFRSQGMARVALRTMLDPFRRAPLMQWSSQVFTPSPIAGLGQDALTRVQEWAEKAKDHPKGLGIAMRRTLSAVSDRIDLLDGFIDAMMAWENMFSGSPETNLRVCGAIAWLLEPDDYERRRQLFDELKDLYTKRSNLVHGAIETVADRIAVESIRRLCTDDKLLRIKDSADRGGVILLGAR